MADIMRIFNRQFPFVLISLAALLAGCSTEPEPAPRARKPSPPKATPVARKDSKAAATKPGKDTANKTSAVAVAINEFKPPYMKRVDIFFPDGKQKSALKSFANGENGLELKGFIEVGDDTRAMFIIDGRPVMLRSGDERGSLKVLEVDPPNVSLKRGIVQWTETIASPAQ